MDTTYNHTMDKQLWNGNIGLIPRNIKMVKKNIYMYIKKQIGVNIQLQTFSFLENIVQVFVHSTIKRLIRSKIQKLYTLFT